MPIPNSTSIAFDEENSPWSFDVSSFLVLLGENEEVKYRHMRRSCLECFCSAPVAGLQSYLKNPDDIFNSTGREYTSPGGCKKAPLRNMKLHHCLETKGLLKDGNYTVFSIPADSETSTTSRKLNILDLGILLLSILSWSTTAGIITFLCLCERTSWVGFTGCTILSIHSVILKVTERFYSQPADLVTGNPDTGDAIYILGRRNSCFVLQGSRRHIAEMTGQGIRMKKGTLPRRIANTTRIFTFIVLIFIFVVIPNGTTWDQLAFICLNILSQFNVIVGQRLNTSRFFRTLEVEEEVEVPTRTHVYAKLIRKFGNGSWVDMADLLPQTDAWTVWREKIYTADNGIDAKELYNKCKNDDTKSKEGLQKQQPETIGRLSQ